MRLEDLSQQDQKVVAEILSGQLKIEEDYANVSDDVAIYLLNSQANVPESEARFQIAMARGEIDGDVILVERR